MLMFINVTFIVNACRFQLHVCRESGLVWELHEQVTDSFRDSQISLLSYVFPVFNSPEVCASLDSVATMRVIAVLLLVAAAAASQQSANPIRKVVAWWLFLCCALWGTPLVEL